MIECLGSPDYQASHLTKDAVQTMNELFPPKQNPAPLIRYYNEVLDS